MNQSIFSLLSFLVVVLAVGLLVPTLIAAQTFPDIPHSLEGRDNCLACHGAGLAGIPQVPADHSGLTVDECQTCHQVAADVKHGLISQEAPIIPHPLEKRDDCRACHTTGADGAPQFPANHVDRPNETCRGCHQLEAPDLVTRNCLDCHIIGSGSPEAEAQTGGEASITPHPLARHEDCLACHQEGVGRAPRFPDDHAGQTNDFCSVCHQPAAPPPPRPVPTPINVDSWPRGVNNCRDCHLRLGEERTGIIAQWEDSIHAASDVTCVDCHGGDPVASLKEDAKSAEANYIGRPAREDIPALCASCHSDSTLMAQYNLPTDQYDTYQESVHGFLLAKGDRKVATCFDCHGGHQTLSANDPDSPANPVNVPALCAGCHADETVMGGYNVPIDQYELYRQSVHGRALLDDQNLNAPTCATCHGNHGDAPSGFGEVVNLCGDCHTSAQTYFLQGPHGGAGRGLPECVTCHGRYDVNEPTEAMFVGTESRHCGACHPPDSEPGQVAQMLYNELTGAVEAYTTAADAVQSARQTGMPVELLDVQLREAEAALGAARVAQHRLDLDLVRDKTGEAGTLSRQAEVAAQSIVTEDFRRRLAMTVVLVAVGVATVALYSLTRTLGRQSKAEEQE